MGIFSLFSNSRNSGFSDRKKRSHQGSSYYKRTHHSRSTLFSNMFSKKSYSKSFSKYKKKRKNSSSSWWS